MYLDVFTLSALVDEFMDTLVGGRVQDSLSVDETGLGLEIYASHQRRYLYLSADPQTPRIQLVPEKLRRGLPKPTQLGLLFRRYVEGGAITHVSQPEWERILHIEVAGPEGDVTIIVEPMERRSNLLLIQNGIILDCMRRVGPDENRYRVSLPNQPYVPPPEQTGKLNPFKLTLESLIGLFEQNQDAKRKTHQVLTSRLLGVSPLLAKEIVYRATGGIDQKAVAADPEKLLTALTTLLAPLERREWQPGVAENTRGVEAYSVYPLESLDGWHRVESVSEAMTLYYSAPVGEEAYDAAKVPVREAIHEAAGKLRGKLESLQRSMTDESERESLRQSGELILAYQYAIQKGQAELRAQYDFDAPELAIPLDPTLTPLENAQRYFEKYNKAKRALDDVPEFDRADGERTRLSGAVGDRPRSGEQLARNRRGAADASGERLLARQAAGAHRRGRQERAAAGRDEGRLRHLGGAQQPPERDRHVRQGQPAGFMAARARGRRGARDHQARRAADARSGDSGGGSAGGVLQRGAGRKQRDRGRDAAPLRAQDQGRGGGHGDVSQRRDADGRAARRNRRLERKSAWQSSA